MSQDTKHLRISAFLDEKDLRISAFFAKINLRISAKCYIFVAENQ